MSESKIKTLQFQNEKSPSLIQKTSIIAWYIICLAVALYLTFMTSDTDQLDINNRLFILLLCVIIYIIRAALTLFVFVKRKIPWWEAVWGGSIIGIVLFFFLLSAFSEIRPLRIIDTLGIGLYLLGSYIGTASEYSRYIWKTHPENQGHLYTQGLFRCTRHINYFGDLLLFTGLAILTGQLWTGFVPLGMSLNFILVIIPAHDNYLAERYGGEYYDYEKKTRKLIPYIY